MQTYFFTIVADESLLAEQATQNYTLERGQTLFNNFTRHNLKTHSKCGGKAICGQCRIKILSGSERCNKPLKEEKVILSDEELKQGWRLSCQLYCLANVSILIPTEVFLHKTESN